MNKAIDNFLKANRPQAPKAPADEWNRLHATARSQARPNRWFDWQWVIPAFVAAGLFSLFIIPGSHFTGTEPSETAQNLDIFLEDTISGFYEDNGISDVDIEIGTDWIRLTEI